MLGVNTTGSDIEILDDVSARLTIHNVSRDMSGSHLGCVVTGNYVDHVISSDVVIRVAGTPQPCYLYILVPRPAF